MEELDADEDQHRMVDTPDWKASEDDDIDDNASFNLKTKKVQGDSDSDEDDVIAQQAALANARFGGL